MLLLLRLPERLPVEVSYRWRLPRKEYRKYKEIEGQKQMGVVMEKESSAAAFQ